MSAGETHEHDLQAAVRRYLYVFYALLFGTGATVAASYIPFGNHGLNVAVALFIAVCKGTLVVGFFMHLMSERKLIYGLLAFTVLFVAGLMALTVYGTGPDGMIHLSHVP